MTAATRRGLLPRGQATVETALVLPVVVLVLAMLAQVVLVVRDELRVLHAARLGARAAVVDPRPAAVRAAVDDADLPLHDLQVRLGGSSTPGGLVEVEVSARPARVPLVGVTVAGVVLRERLVAMVE